MTICRHCVSVVNDYADFEKSNKNVIWYFRKLHVSVVVDCAQYADICPRSCWLRRHVLKKSLTTRTRCWCSHRLRGQRCRRSQQIREHGQDYADTFGKLWRLLTDFKGTIRWKMVLGCIYKLNRKFKNMKTLYLKKNLTTRTRDFRTVWLIIRKNEHREN